MESKTKPNVYIIAGPNGAGKTTFAKDFLPSSQCRIFVNADQIAEGIAPYVPESASIKAGRIFLKDIYDLVDKKCDFAFESTLSGRTYVLFLKKLRSLGYQIHIYYLWIPSVDLALGRIKERVALGGHDIPEKDVRRRFNKSWENFWKYYRPLTDEWTLIDNSKIPLEKIADGKKEKINIFKRELFEKIKG